MVRWTGKGGAETAVHGGAAECWCKDVPPDPNKPAARGGSKHDKKEKERKGHLKTGCPWRVCWNRKQALGRISGTAEKQYVWHCTPTRVLAHNHPLTPPIATDSQTITSLHDIPAEVEDMLRSLVVAGLSGEGKLRRFVEMQLKSSIEDSVFHNLLNRVKASVGMSILGEGEFKQLCLWLWAQMEEAGVFTRFDADSTEISRVMYMSPDMRYNSSATCRCSAWTQPTILHFHSLT